MHGGIGMTDEHDIGLYMKREAVLGELADAAQEIFRVSAHRESKSSAFHEPSIGNVPLVLSRLSLGARAARPAVREAPASDQLELVVELDVPRQLFNGRQGSVQ